MNVEVIIAAAGQGTRMKTKTAKALIPLKGKPLILYSLEVFESCSLVKSMVVVTHKNLMGRLKSLLKKAKISKVKKVMEGGATRQQSVYNGLKVLDRDTDIVLVHDAARPFVSQDMVKEVIENLKKEDGVIIGVPVKPTIKKVDVRTGYALQTLNRSSLYEIQTPQGFKKGLLLKAHQKLAGRAMTDDAALLEALGFKVKVVKGSYNNIKITTEEDLHLAKLLIRS